jgi:hypothetical protein
MSGDRLAFPGTFVQSLPSNRRLSRYVTSAGRIVFGDRVGVTLWLVTVLTLALWWRVGFFITDTYPIANAVANLGEGRLAMGPQDFEYSLTLGTQPGLHEYGGDFYARNYGQVVAAVPILWALEAATFFGPPRLVLAASWSVGVIVLGRQLATLADRVWLRSVSAAIALVWFVATAVFATALDRSQLALVALQLSTLFAAGLVGVFCYRLLAAFHDRQVAIAGGLGLVLATPVGFWATIPKRHVLVTALVFVSVFSFARSRQLDGRHSYVAHGVAYGAIGLVAWIHAFEGFFLTIALFAVDVITESRKSPRRIVVVAGIFALSLLPLFVTNVLISGNPLQPPRLLPDVGPGSVELAPEGGPETGGSGGSGGTGGDGAGSTGDGGSGSTGDGGSGSGESGSDGSGDGPGIATRLFDVIVGIFPPLLGLLAVLEKITGELVFIGNYAITAVTRGVEVTGETDRLWNVFVRHGYYEASGDLSANDFEMIDLSVLESTPIVGTLVALPAMAVAHVRRHGVSLSGLTPRRQNDLLVVAYVLVLTVVYLPRLPLFSQITVRYLLPAITLAAYCPFRIPAVRDAITGSTRVFAGTYAGSVIVGTPLVAAILWWLDPALGEAVQFHALLGLTVAVIAAVVVSGRALAPSRVPPRTVAVGVALAGGATTVFLLLSSVEYFTYAPFAFDVTGRITDFVSIL